jgi:hypothetical protein
VAELKKATLQEISNELVPVPIGPAVEVQFNPTTLRLQLHNQISGGDTRGQQTTQILGASSTTLSLDLIFDTADEGTTERPISVRERTARVERFVLPKAPGGEAPPKLRFQWASLVVEGIVDSLAIDFDHFAANGTPLRAKVGLSIREQDPKYQFLKTGPGSNTKGGAPAPGGIGLGAVGGASIGLGLGLGASVGLGGSINLGAQASLALGGETAAEFSARVGLDPGAWRGLDVDLSGGLTLEAGTEVGFDSDLSAGLGLGSTPGVAAGASQSLEASLGLEAPATAQGSPLAAARQSGFALAAAGGLGAAVETAQAIRAADAASAARVAFGVVGESGNRIAEDPRATTFGFGVPLRARATSPATAGRGKSGAAAGLVPAGVGGGCSCGCGGKH